MDRIKYESAVADLATELSQLVTAFCRVRGLSFDPANMQDSFIDLEDVAREALVVGAGVEPDLPASPAGGYRIGRANLSKLAG